jgi:L-ascorbate metabolism protein UlaG (beta-lactamase superfamily)
MRLTPLAALAALCLSPLAASAADAAPKTEITWYGHAAFTVKTPGGTVLAIDPFFANPKSPDKKAGEALPKVDYILITHGHGDHVGEAVAIATRTGAKLITNFDLCKALVAGGYPEAQASMATCGNIGGAIQAGDATVNMVPAVHSSGIDVEKNGGTAMGFVIQVKGGPTIYHTGDTDVTMDMKQIPERFGKVDVMLACIGGHFTMDPKGAAMAAGYVKAKTVVPMHFQTFPVIPGSPEELKAALPRGTRMLVMEPGKPATF